jgi:hypothetical protein
MTKRNKEGWGERKRETGRREQRRKIEREERVKPTRKGDESRKKGYTAT